MVPEKLLDLKWILTDTHHTGDDQYNLIKLRFVTPKVEQIKLKIHCHFYIIRLEITPVQKLRNIHFLFVTTSIRNINLFPQTIIFIFSTKFSTFHI